MSEDIQFEDSLLDEYTAKWCGLALTAGTQIDEVALRKGVDLIYRLAKFDPPQQVIICDSPDEVQKTAQRLLGVDSYVSYSATSLSNVGWVSFYDVFCRETDVMDAELKALFMEYCEFLESGVFAAIYLDEVAIVSRRPRVLRRDEEFRLHHDQLPAIEFEDGFKLFSLDGIVFEEDLFRKVSSKTITLEEINAIQNADQRACAYKWGLPPLTMLKDMNAELVNTGSRGTQLFKIPNFFDTGTTQYAILMPCPTGRTFLEFVEPEVAERCIRDYPDDSSEAAQSAAYGISYEEYTSIVLHG